MCMCGIFEMWFCMCGIFKCKRVCVEFLKLLLCVCVEFLKCVCICMEFYCVDVCMCGILNFSVCMFGIFKV